MNIVKTGLPHNRWLPVCRHENQPDVGHFAVSDTGAELMGDGCYFCVEMYDRPSVIDPIPDDLRDTDPVCPTLDVR